MLDDHDDSVKLMEVGVEGEHQIDGLFVYGKLTVF